MTLLARQLLICLGAAHTITDFCLSPGHTARNKPGASVLLLRALMAAATSYLLCGAWTTWMIPLGVFAGHALVDVLKGRWPRGGAASFLLDQLGHAATVLIVAVVVARQGVALYGVDQLGAMYLKVLIVVTGVILAVFASGVLIGLAVEPLLAELRKSQDQLSPEERGFEHGGRYIGWLERALSFVFVISGQPSSIGFLIAAKSIFRFGELKEQRHRMEAEYIIIGTMMSVGHGLLVAYVTKCLLELSWTSISGSGG